ncbi:MAG: glycine/betaine ABC transporter substrate-binding protein [Synergistales bacterium]|nr:glycine/betaine ABC transporter substrate-binding protein [Synergistales bacterium]
MRKHPVVAVLLVAALVLGCFAGVAAADGKKKLAVGAKFYTEQYILGNMLALYLDHHGFDVNKNMGTGSSVTRKALATGQIDIYAEYTGTAWMSYMKQDEVINDPGKLYRAVKEKDLKDNGIVWFAKAPMNNTFALVIPKEKTDAYGKTISSLAEYNNNHPDELIFGMDQEFYERNDGFFEMADLYGMEVDKKQVKLMSVGLSYESLQRGQIDVGMAYSTDGKILKYNLQVLKDDRKFFPPYTLAICVREETMERYPELKELLSPLTETLTDETMQKLNYQVDAEGKPAEMVAQVYLGENGFID